MKKLSFEQLSDEELAFLSQKHQAMFEELIKRYQQRVYAFIWHFCNHREVAYDLTQEVFIKTYFALDRFDHKKKFATWIFTIARHVCIDQSRKRTVAAISLEQSKLDAVLATKQHTPHQAVEKTNRAYFMQQSIAKLKPEYREVIILFYLQELSYQEIAAILKKPLGTIKSQLLRAKEALKTLLQDYKEALI